MRKLREAGLQLYIISNSSRRSPVTASKLASLGFDSSWFEGDHVNSLRTLPPLHTTSPGTQAHTPHLPPQAQ